MVICGKDVRLAFVEALMKILVYMRDEGAILVGCQYSFVIILI